MAENVGVTPPDLETVAGNVRLLTGDTKPAPLDPPVTGQGEYAWYSDEELEALGVLFGGSARRVAIYVLSIVSVNEAMLLKKWTSEDLTVDGPAIIKGIENTLKRLSAELDREEILTGDSEFFGVYGGDDNGPRIPYPEGLTFQYYPFWR